MPPPSSVCSACSAGSRRDGSNVHIRSLGHVMLKVRDLGRSESFYADTLGMPVAFRLSDPAPMTFFTLGHHHDLALIELDADGVPADPPAVGLGHVAFEVSGSTKDLQAAKDELEAAGVAIRREWSSGFADSLFVLDPDGNEVELYVETPSRTGLESSSPGDGTTATRFGAPPRR